MKGRCQGSRAQADEGIDVILARSSVLVEGFYQIVRSLEAHIPHVDTLWSG